MKKKKKYVLKDKWAVVIFYLFIVVATLIYSNSIR